MLKTSTAVSYSFVLIRQSCADKVCAGLEKFVIANKEGENNVAPHSIMQIDVAMVLQLSGIHSHEAI